MDTSQGFNVDETREFAYKFTLKQFQIIFLLIVLQYLGLKPIFKCVYKL
jgi:hypothetical protein